MVSLTFELFLSLSFIPVVGNLTLFNPYEPNDLGILLS